MKFLFFILTASAFIACNNADQPSAGVDQHKKDSLFTIKDSMAQIAMNDTTSYTTIEWLDPIQTDLGKITEGQQVEVSWRFKNSGSKPLIIQNVSATCGCTVAERPEAPVAPGESSVIKAKFNSEGQHIGHVEKTVMVQANTKGTTTHTLRFSAEINK